jgi:cysteinyl-tRNA synthetase
MKWGSRFGPDGFPGWHIECSAMARKHLGEQIDIHTGGEDNVFPHHECEIAQTEAITGKPFARYWMHAKFLTVDGGKMSKSLGNVYTLDDVRERGFDTYTLRYALLRGHYRRPIDFTWGVLAEARSALEGLAELRARLRFEQDAAERGAEHAEVAERDFRAAMDDDLSVPEALAAVFTLRDHALHGRVGGAAASKGIELLERFDRTLGVLPPEDTSDDTEIEALVREREAARAAKDWAASDRLRDELLARGIVLQDSAGGTIWRRG